MVWLGWVIVHTNKHHIPPPPPPPPYQPLNQVTLNVIDLWIHTATPSGGLVAGGGTLDATTFTTDTKAQTLTLGFPGDGLVPGGGEFRSGAVPPRQFVTSPNRRIAESPSTSPTPHINTSTPQRLGTSPPRHLTTSAPHDLLHDSTAPSATTHRSRGQADDQLRGCAVR